MKNFWKTLSVFYHYIMLKKGLFILFIILTVISSFLSYVLPYFFKLFVDNLQSLNYDFLFKLVLVLVGVRYAGVLTHTFSFYVGDMITFNAVIKARQEIFKHVADLDFVFHMNKSTGYLISAFKRGDGAFWSMFHELHHRFLSIFVGFLVMTYFFAQIDWIISVVVIGSFVMAVVLAQMLVKINITARRLHNDEEDNVSAIIVDNMINFETVKLFSQEERELNRLKNAFVPWLATGWKYVNTFRLIDLSMGTLINISIFFLLYFALFLSRRGELTVGEFVLIIGFISNFYPRLWELIFGLREVGKHYADIQKYIGLLEYEVKIKDPSNPLFLEGIKGEIEFKDVSFTYEKGKKEAIKNLNFKIRQGQSVAFVGRSGSGKTTIIRLLMRFYNTDEGNITVDGHDITNLTKSHLRSFIGVVPQEPVLFDNTLAYNIAYGKADATKDEIVAASKIANLHDFILSLPKKYSTNVGERGIKLSGGQKQRLAIARMVLSDPDIIIFDEATSQLDSENERLIQESLWKVARDKTTIIIAHRLSTAMRADKIIVMEKGKIIEEGSHGEFLKNEKSLYKHFWNLQVNVDN